MLSKQFKVSVGGREIYYTKNTHGDYLVTHGAQDWLIKQRRWQEFNEILERGEAMRDALEKCTKDQGAGPVGAAAIKVS